MPAFELFCANGFQLALVFTQPPLVRAPGRTRVTVLVCLPLNVVRSTTRVAVVWKEKVGRGGCV